MREDAGYRRIALECDNCSNGDTYEGFTHKELNADLKEEGWIFTSRKGEFLDFCCQECADEYLKEEK